MVLDAVMLSVTNKSIMLSVIMLNAVLLSVVAPLKVTNILDRQFTRKKVLWQNLKVKIPYSFTISTSTAKCYKTFYICNLLMLVISLSVCPWQASPSKSNVCK